MSGGAKKTPVAIGPGADQAGHGVSIRTTRVLVSKKTLKLAAKLKRPQSYVSKYEHGERRLDLIEFLEIAEALDIDVPSFIDEIMKMEDRDT